MANDECIVGFHSTVYCTFVACVNRVDSIGNGLMCAVTFAFLFVRLFGRRRFSRSIWIGLHGGV